MLLLSLYWHQILQKNNVQVRNFLGRLRWLFLAVSVLTFIFEVILSALRATVDNTKILGTINVVCYVAFGLGA